MKIDEAIRIFSKFLNSSWDIVTPLLLEREYTSNIGSINDWFQANWEILVERKVLDVTGYLDIYGEGADCYGASSRMTDIDAIPTFTIKVVLANDAVKDLLNNEILANTEFFFDKLVGFENGFYTNKPPFNYVLIQENDSIERIVHLKNIKFELSKI